MTDSMLLAVALLVLVATVCGYLAGRAGRIEPWEPRPRWRDDGEALPTSKDVPVLSRIKQRKERS